MEQLTQLLQQVHNLLENIRTVAKEATTTVLVFATAKEYAAITEEVVGTYMGVVATDYTLVGKYWTSLTLAATDQAIC